MNLLELAEKVAAASENDVELFSEAYEAVFGNSPVVEYRQPNGYRGTTFVRLLEVEAFLDAALLLVPEGWEFYLERNGAALWDGRESSHRRPIFRAHAATPALALTAASLKARALQGEG